MAEHGIDAEVDVTKSSLFNIKSLVITALQAEDGGKVFKKIVNADVVLESWTQGTTKLTLRPTDVRAADGGGMALSAKMRFSTSPQ